MHWFDAESRAWLSRARGSQRWRGWKADCSDCVETTERAHWVPWPGGVCDESEAPFVRWYCGGLTNAAFNEVCAALPRASACLAALSAVPKRAFGDCGAARPPRYRRSRARDRVRLRAGRGRTAFAHRQARAAHSLGGRSGDAPRRPRPLRWATRRHLVDHPSAIDARRRGQPVCKVWLEAPQREAERAIVVERECCLLTTKSCSSRQLSVRRTPSLPTRCGTFSRLESTQSSSASAALCRRLRGGHPSSLT